jgi:hypothetical protein
MGRGDGSNCDNSIVRYCFLALAAHSERQHYDRDKKSDGPDDECDRAPDVFMKEHKAGGEYGNADQILGAECFECHVFR